MASRRWGWPASVLTSLRRLERFFLVPLARLADFGFVFSQICLILLSRLKLSSVRVRASFRAMWLQFSLVECFSRLMEQLRLSRERRFARLAPSFRLRL